MGLSDMKMFAKVRKEVFKQVIEQLKDTLVFSVGKTMKAIPSEKEKHEAWLNENVNPLV